MDFDLIIPFLKAYFGNPLIWILVILLALALGTRRRLRRLEASVAALRKARSLEP